MRAFLLQDFLYSIKVKQHVLQGITGRHEEFYLGPYSSLLVAEKRTVIYSSMMDYSMSPEENVHYELIDNLWVMKPVCDSITKERLETIQCYNRTFNELVTKLGEVPSRGMVSAKIIHPFLV